MTRSLFVVGRGQPTLHTYMRDYFTGRPDIEIILDRRELADRRHHPVPVVTERRISQRRVHNVSVQLDTVGFAVVTVRCQRQAR